MSFYQNLRHDLNTIRAAPAGRRFILHYRRHRSREEPRWRGMLLIALGVILVAAGALLGLAPGAPGILLGIPGLTLIAARLQCSARALDRAELTLYRLWRRVRRPEQRPARHQPRL